MGDYTEIILGCALKSDVPDYVLDVLFAMGKGNAEDITLATARVPEAEAINFPNPFVGHSESFPTFVGMKLEKDRLWRLTSRTNLKNYKGEVESFLAWLEPYIEEGSGANDCYAITFHEANREPELFCLISDDE